MDAATDRLAAIERRLAERPDDAAATLEAGLLLERLGDRPRAQQYLARAWRLGAPPERALPALVRVGIALDDLHGALVHGRAYRAALPACPRPGAATPACRRWAEASALLGAVAAAVGRADEARAAFSAALAADPAQEEARAALARQGDAGAALP